MAERRKLQGEIDKTLKRVEEGVADFNSLLLKVDEIQTSAQKEKIEGELKREIKKLQRFRDQIKAWCSAADVKDKGPLEEARKSIEKQMERFKVCEKTFKIKAFSKEGLAQPVKIDPIEALRERHRKWIRESLDRISGELDDVEARMEKGRIGRKGKTKIPETDQHLEELMGQYKWHIGKLELVLRKLDNDELDITQLDDLKEGVDLYLACCKDDNVLCLTAEDIYLPLGLEEGPPEDLLHPDKGQPAEEGAAHPPTPWTADHQSGQTTEPKAPTPQAETAEAAEATTQQPDEKERNALLGKVPHPKASSTASWNPPISYAAVATASKARPVQECARSTGNPQSGGASGQAAEEQQPTGTTSSLLRAFAPSSSEQKTPPTGQAEVVLMQILDHAYENIPEQKHRRHFRYYLPRTVWSNPAPSFPTQPIKDYASPRFFAKLDLDTLFFVFYYQQGTYQQYLASRELKKHNWRYHKKYLTWFQPQPGPTQINEQFHRGNWVYFDSESGWCSRAKQEFSFEFQYLEDQVEGGRPVLSGGSLQAPPAGDV